MRSGRGALPLGLLLLLAALPAQLQARPLTEPDPDHRIQVKHQNNLMHEHEVSEKEDVVLTAQMTTVTAFESLKDSNMEKPTSQALFSEESDPEVPSTEEDSSQSMKQEQETSANGIEHIVDSLKEDVPSTEDDSSQSMKQEQEISPIVIENTVDSLKEEDDKPRDQMESSFLDKILQELKTYLDDHLTELHPTTSHHKMLGHRGLNPIATLN